MGACSSGGKGVSSGIGNKQVGTVQSAPTFRTLTKKDTNEWISKQDAINFTGSAPDNIKIGDISFSKIDEYKSVDSKGRTQYCSVYQSSTQANNGEYPIFETVVDTVKKGKLTQYQFNTSVIGGSGLK